MEMGRKGTLSGACYLLVLLTNVLCDPYEPEECLAPVEGDTQNVHEFKIDGLTNNLKYDFSDYKNKVMLIVNVASF